MSDPFLAAYQANKAAKVAEAEAPAEEPKKKAKHKPAKKQK